MFALSDAWTGYIRRTTDKTCIVLYICFPQSPVHYECEIPTLNYTCFTSFYIVGTGKKFSFNLRIFSSPIFFFLYVLGDCSNCSDYYLYICHHQILKIKKKLSSKVPVLSCLSFVCFLLTLLSVYFKRPRIF